jgi:hypothetical protein
LLTRPTVIDRLAVSWAAEVVSTVAVEARLRGVQIELADLQHDSQILLDSSWCRPALTGLLHCMLALSPGAGAVLTIRTQMTAVRPALILECHVSGGSPSAGSMVPDVRPVLPVLNDDALARFFDAEWQEHPCGPSGGLMLAALAKTARAHGGRAQVQSPGTVMFVVPRPLL